LEVIDELKQDDRVRSFAYSSNSGNACRGRNHGITMALGEYICFHDSDDIAHPDRLLRTAETIDLCGAEAVYGPTKLLMDGTRQIEGLRNGQVFDPPEFDYDLLRQMNIMMTCSVSVKRELLLRRGMFRPEMRYREDHELWLRLAFHGCRWARSEHLLSYYRVHAGNAELVLRDNDAHWYEQAIYWHDKAFYIDGVVL
jgi:glycosyltransferase involved in cell wall biosynthesis